MPLQTIRVTPADRKNGNKAKRDDAKPCPPPPACAPSPMEDEDESPEAISSRRRSSSSVGGAGGDICRICHCEAGPDLPLISPCWCSGSLRFVHQQCLQQWIKSSDARCCELCKFQFVMRTTLKPFRKWEKLEMSSVERRKVLCSMAFHAVAVTCVVWSLWVLIERTAEEVRNGALEWPFWTKLVVVGVGFTGGLVFMYVQCKMYAQLFRRWRAYNRIIQVQDAPDKQHSQAVFSAAAHQTADVLTSAADEETKRQVSPDEDELFHSCESGRSSSNSSNSSSDDGERRRQQLRGDEDEDDGRLQAVTAETGSNKTTLTSVTDTNPPLGEVVVVLPPGGGGGERRHDS